MRRLTARVVLFCWLISVVARGQAAQPWLEDRREVRGAGIRSGDLELHPGVAGEFGYDSNFFQASGDTGEPTAPSLRLRLTPSLSLETLGGARVAGDADEAAPPKVKFRAASSLSLDTLFSLRDEFDEQVDGASYVSGDLAAVLNVSPDRPWGADFNAGFTRISQAYNLPGAVTFDRNMYHGGADLRWRPGGGLLEWNIGYGARLTRFDETTLALDTLAHGLRARGLWRFLPRTVLLYQGELGFVARLFEGTRLRNADIHSSQLGLNGLITPRLGALLMGGWKAIFFGADAAGNIEEFDGPIGRAEVTWFINGHGKLDPAAADVGFSTFKVGYSRDAFPSELSNYYRLDRGYGELTALIGGVVVVRASGGMSHVQHSLPRSADGRALTSPAPREWRPDAQLYVEYRLGRSLGIFANSGFSASPRSNSISTGSGGVDSLKYSRVTALLGARWFL
jgi:hypothetical protein